MSSFSLNQPLIFDPTVFLCPFCLSLAFPLSYFCDDSLSVFCKCFQLRTLHFFNLYLTPNSVDLRNLMQTGQKVCLIITVNFSSLKSAAMLNANSTRIRSSGRCIWQHVSSAVLNPMSIKDIRSLDLLNFIKQHLPYDKWDAAAFTASNDDEAIEKSLSWFESLIALIFTKCTQ